MGDSGSEAKRASGDASDGMSLRFAMCHLFNGSCRPDAYVSIRGSRLIQPRHQHVLFAHPEDSTSHLIAQAAADFSPRCSQAELLQWVCKRAAQHPEQLLWHTVQTDQWKCNPESHWDRAALHVQVHARAKIPRKSKGAEVMSQTIETHIGYAVLPLCQLAKEEDLGGDVVFLIPSNERFVFILDLKQSTWGKGQESWLQWIQSRRMHMLRHGERLQTMNNQAYDQYLKANLYYFTIDEQRPFARKSIRRYQNSFVDVTESTLYCPRKGASSSLVRGAGGAGAVRGPVSDPSVLHALGTTKVRVPGAWFVTALAPSPDTQIPSNAFWDRCLHRALLQMGSVPPAMKRKRMEQPGDNPLHHLYFYCELLTRICTCIWRVYHADVQDACPLFGQDADRKKTMKERQERFRHVLGERVKRYHAVSRFLDEQEELGHSCSSAAGPGRGGGGSKSHIMEDKDEYYGILGSLFPELTADDCESLSRAVYVMLVLLGKLSTCPGRAPLGTTLGNVAWLASHYVGLYVSCAAEMSDGSQRDVSSSPLGAKKDDDDGYESDHGFDRQRLRDGCVDLRKSFPDTSRDERLRPNHVVVVAVPQKTLTRWLSRAEDQKKKRHHSGEGEKENKEDEEREQQGVQFPVLVLESTECAPGLQDLKLLPDADMVQWEANRKVFFDTLESSCPYRSAIQYCRTMQMVHRWNMYHTMVVGYTHGPWFSSVDADAHYGELVFVNRRSGYRGVRAVDFFSSSPDVMVVAPGFHGKPSVEHRQACETWLEQQVAAVAPIEAWSAPPLSKMKSWPESWNKHGYTLWVRAVDWVKIQKGFESWCRDQGWSCERESSWCEDQVETVFLSISKKKK